MSESSLGRTLVIANPAAHSGKGAQGAKHIEAFLANYLSFTCGFEMRRTEAAGDARHMAREAAGFDTLIALGGDGIIHEIVNGLMALPESERPQLGIVPAGSGNDYARTLGMDRASIERALAQVVHGRARQLEVGRVNDEYFAQTLSFGMDAAIALDTSMRREAGTSQEGEALFVTSGVKKVLQSKKGWPCTAQFDDEAPIRLRELVFAVQVGPTYGGGFHICPAADPTDGLLDVCYNVKKPPLPVLLTLFGMARGGHHTSSRAVQLRRARHIELDFEEELPVQADGEPVLGTRFEVDVMPNALRVIIPAESRR